MAFYHVLIATDQDPNGLREVFRDLTKKELKRNVVKPYRQGTSLTCGNEIIPFSRIGTIHIVETTASNEVERDAMHGRAAQEIEDFNRNSTSLVRFSTGRGYDPRDIIECGRDVKETFIPGFPGSAERRREHMHRMIAVAAASTSLVGSVWGFMHWWRTSSAQEPAATTPRSTAQSHPAPIAAHASVKDAAATQQVRPRAEIHTVPSTRKPHQGPILRVRRVQMAIGVPVELVPGFNMRVVTLAGGSKGDTVWLASPSWGSVSPTVAVGGPPFNFSQNGRLYQLRVESTHDELVTVSVRP